MSSSDVNRSRESDRKPYSLRLPTPLYEQLQEASDTTGESMNQLIAVALARFLERPELVAASGEGDVDEGLAAAAIADGSAAIGPLKGLAKHLTNRGQPVLASVLYAAAARLIADEEGAEAGSRELVRTGNLMERTGHTEAATALYEKAIALNPSNLEASSRLGQRLHHLAYQQGDDVEMYRRAAEHLRSAASVDNYAKLFYGWSALHVARADGSQADADSARRHIKQALERWAFGQQDPASRPRWMRQLRDLLEVGEDDLVQDLIDFARANTHWDPITQEELGRSRQ